MANKLLATPVLLQQTTMFTQRKTTMMTTNDKHTLASDQHNGQ